ncbi:MAG: VWA domain-containing protein [Candidatus Riflebacteria bacterium]|nr:VWA domain-containing protein [Candidatus Riflebacteria bacterium]
MNATIMTVLRLLGFDMGAIHHIESMRFDLGWGWAGLVLALIALSPFVVVFYRLENKPRTPLLRTVLTTLRLAFFFGLVTLLAGPKLSVSGAIPQKNKLAVLIDSSRSMSISEEGKVRLDMVRDALNREHLLDRLEKKTGIAPAVFSFSGQVAPLSRDDISSFSVVADGNQTNLTRAVQEVTNNLGEGNLLGIVLFTDGAHNTGDNPLDVLTRRRTPLYFLGAGKSGMSQDLSISLDHPPAIGYLNSLIKVRGEVRAWRLASEAVDLEIKKDGKIFQTLRVPIPAGEHKADFSFNLPCDAEGSFQISVSVPHLQEELTWDNNETSFLLKVVKDRLQVLMLSDGPSWEQGFLKAALRSDPNAHFTGFTRLKDDRWLVTEDFEFKGTVVTPKLSSEDGGLIDQADTIILAGVNESFLRPVADVLQRRLESGKLGLLILPGSHPYGDLGFTGSSLESLFPVELHDGAWKGVPVNPVLTLKDAGYAFLHLLDDPNENQDFFRTLPKWDGLYFYPRMRPGSEILLSSTLELPGSPAPAMLHHRVGQGHVVMLMGGPLWPMGFKSVPTGKGIKPYTAFVVNLLKWLANRREDAQVSIDIPSTQMFVGQPATFRVWVSDSARRPLDNAQVTGILSGTDIQQTSLTFLAAGEKGLYESTYVPFRRGNLELTVEAKYQASKLGEAKGRLLVELPTVEFDDPEIQVELMTRLASATGGAYCPVERAGELLDLIHPTPGVKIETKILEFRDIPLTLIALLLLPLSEWWIRRRRGYS